MNATRAVAAEWNGIAKAPDFSASEIKPILRWLYVGVVWSGVGFAAWALAGALGSRPSLEWLPPLRWDRAPTSNPISLSFEPGVTPWKMT